MKRIRRAACRSTTRPSPRRKTLAPARALKHRCARVRVVLRRRRLLKRSVLLKECQRLESFVRQDRHLHNCPGDTEGDAAGEAAGDAEAPGGFDGCTGGG